MAFNLQVVRWIELLDTYHMEISHQPCARHGNVHYFRMYPCRQYGRTDDAKIDSFPEVATSASVVNKAAAVVDPDS